MSNSIRPFATARKPDTGDLVQVASGNKHVNAYRVTSVFSFADVAFTANNGEIGVVLDAASDDVGSVLYHYVRVLFQRGLIGIVHYGLLSVISDSDNDQAQEV